ncbi:MAG: CotH kinase family protein [Lachnospiraceae bacterium]|nr:CotH kinase family protein [Lachnospiraceae bacterium]
MTPTPGITNTNAALWIAEPSLSHKSGFYENAFELEIFSEPGTTVYYTLDGSIPTTESHLYNGAISIYDRSGEENTFRTIKNVTSDWRDNRLGEEPVDKAFIVRAVAVDGEGRTSRPVTATYFVDLEKYRHGNVVSLVAEPSDLFGDDGIYVTGREYDDWYLGTQEGDAPERNYGKRGRQYEAEVYFEYFSDTLSFSQNAGLRIQGASKRSYALKNFTLYARKEYSGSNVFDENIFSDVTSHKLILRKGYANSVFQDLVRDRDVATQRYKCVSVFLNGEFWYDTVMLEKYDAHYFEERFGVKADDVVVIKNDSIEEGVDEDLGLRQDMYNFLIGHDMSIDADYMEFGEIVDLQSYIDYMCVNIYIHNMDFHETKNMVMWRSRSITPNGYGDGKWRWALYDLDAMEWATSDAWDYTWEVNSFSMVPQHIGMAINQQTIYRYLKDSPIFRKQFVLTFMDLVNTDFVYANVKTKMDDYEFDNYEFNLDKDYYENFFKNRAAYIVPHMAEEFGLSGTLETVELTINDADAGYVVLNTIKPDLSVGVWTGNYYTDYPIKVTAVANKGYEFVGWEGDAVSENECMEVQVVEGGVKIHALFRKMD